MIHGVPLMSINEVLWDGSFEFVAFRNAKRRRKNLRGETPVPLGVGIPREVLDGMENHFTSEVYRQLFNVGCRRELEH